MLENANKTTQDNLTRIDENIKVTGGIWFGNGDNQVKIIADGGSCTGVLFSGVDTLTFKPTKIVNTQTYAAWFCNIRKLLIENVEVYIPDIPDGVAAHNQDGIHIQGPSSNITIQNCILKAHDNVIALNADDVAQGTYSTTGDITDVFIDNIHFNETYQGMLLLSGVSKLDRVRIGNITGSARYLVRLWTWNLGVGNYGDITIENINIDWDEDQTPNSYRNGLIAAEGLIDTLRLKNIKIGKGSGVGYNHAIDIVKQFVSQTIINNLIVDGFESNTVTGDSTFFIPSFVYGSEATIHALNINNVKSKYCTSNNGVIPLQLVSCNVDTITMGNFDVTNAKNGALYITSGTIGKVVYDKVILDSSSKNNIYANGTNVGDIKVSNSLDVKLINRPTTNGGLSSTIGKYTSDYVYRQTSLPLDSYWYKGALIYNDTPVAGGYIGWVCTDQGYCFKSVWAPSTAYAVGDIIKAGSGLFMCKIAGISGATMPSTWSGDSADGTVTWTFYGTAIATFKGFGLIQA